MQHHLHGFQSSKRMRLSHPHGDSANPPVSSYPPSTHLLPPSIDFAALSGCESVVTDGNLASVESCSLAPMNLRQMSFVPNFGSDLLAPPLLLPYHRPHSFQTESLDEMPLQAPNFLQIGSEIAHSQSETRNRFRPDGSLQKMVDSPRRVDSITKSGTAHPLPYLYQLPFGEDIQMVDEGSTSNGNYIQPLMLPEHQVCDSPSELRPSNALSATQDASVSEMTKMFLPLETSAANVSTICGPAEEPLKVCRFAGCGKRSRGASLSCVCHDGRTMCSGSGRTISCNPSGKTCFTLGCTGHTECCYGLCSSNPCENCRKDAKKRQIFYEACCGGENHVVEECVMDSKGSVSACEFHGCIRKCRSKVGAICSMSVHGIGAPDDERCSLEGCIKNGREEDTFCCDENGRVCSLEPKHITGDGRKCSWGDEDKSKHSGNSYDDNLWTYFKGSCDRYTKDTLGFCAEHSALVEDRRVHGSVTFVGSLSARFEVDPMNGELSESINKEDDEGYSCESGSPVADSVEEDFMQEEPKVALFSSMFAGVPCQSLTLDTSTDMQKLIPRTGSILKSCVSLPNVFGYSSMGKLSSNKLSGNGKNSSISDLEDDSIFNMSSLDLPDERVHGGNLMALIGKGSDKT